MSSERAQLTEGPVGKHLVVMTVPVLLGIMTMMGQALVDSWFLDNGEMPYVQALNDWLRKEPIE